jgi:GNAT superfamily N-acetyltransferase
MCSMSAVIRLARRDDVPAIVRLFADDHGGRSSPEHVTLGPGQLAAFDAIAEQPDNSVYVAERDGVVVGTFQLTFIRQLSYGGCLVAQVESVHVHSSQRGQGIGEQLMRFAIELARRRGALRVQLTSNVRRGRAHAFYERLGFEPSHVGMKLYL